MSIARSIVSNTGPLISLEKLPDGFRFIRLLYDKIIVPSSVIEELTEGQFSSRESYITHYNIGDLLEIIDVEDSGPISELELLDRGEREAIVLSVKYKLPLLVEEEKGRLTAQKLGLKISGIAGQVLKAFRLKLIGDREAIEKIDDLYRAGRINKKIHAGILTVIQEEFSTDSAQMGDNP